MGCFSVAWLGLPWLSDSFLKLTPLTGLLGITIKQQSIPHPSLVDHLAGSGLLYDRIPFALICAMLGIFVFGLALQDSRQRLWKMLFLLLALLFFTGPILAGSRMAILLAFFGAISISGLAIGSKQKKGIGLALAAIVFILFAGTWAMSWLTFDHINSAIDTTQNTNRIFIWQRAIEIFVDNPLFGTGYGHYPQVAPMVYHTSDPFRPENNHAHNLFLTMLTETGIAGFWAFAFLWYRWGRGFWEERKEPLMFCAAAGCLLFLVASLVHDPWFHSNIVTVFWWFAAVACTPLPAQTKA